MSEIPSADGPQGRGLVDITFSNLLEESDAAARQLSPLYAAGAVTGMSSTQGWESEGSGGEVMFYAHLRQAAKITEDNFFEPLLPIVEYRLSLYRADVLASIPNELRRQAEHEDIALQELKEPDDKQPFMPYELHYVIKYGKEKGLEWEGSRRYPKSPTCSKTVGFNLAGDSKNSDYMEMLDEDGIIPGPNDRNLKTGVHAARLALGLAFDLLNAVQGKGGTRVLHMGNPLMEELLGLNHS